MKFLVTASAVALFAWPLAAQAQSTAEDKVPAEAAPPPVLTVSGSASLASDYRFRGVSQSDQEMAVQNLTFNVSYVDTDISVSEARYLQPSFSKGQDGTGNIAGSTVVVSLTAAF